MTNFKCEKCNKKLRDKYSLERHYNKKIPCDVIDEECICQYCDKSFSCKSALNRHIKDNCKSIDNGSCLRKLKQRIKTLEKEHIEILKIKKIRNNELSNENKILKKENKKLIKENKKLKQNIDQTQDELFSDTLSTYTNEEIDYDPSDHKDVLDKFNDKSKKCGYVYIVTSEDKSKKCLFKIGFTTNKLSRIKSFKTADPDLEIVAKYKTSDIQYTEKIIHKFLDNVRYKGEFFYVSSLETCKKIVKDFCDFSDNCLEKYSNDYKQLRNHYIKNKQELKL